MKNRLPAIGAIIRVLCLVVATTLASNAVFASGYPDRTIRILVGFTAGGPADIPARFIAERLKTKLGVPVIVEDKPGAGSTLAVGDMLSQPRDGYTIMVCSYLDPVNTLLYRHSKYQLSDLLGITQINKYSYAVAVSNTLPVSNFKELIEYGKKHPKELNYGSVGIASMPGILPLLLGKITGVQMTAIPFKGTLEGLQEVIAGRVQLVFSPPIAAYPFYKAKKLKVLGVTGDERMPSMPDVPTLKESGVPLTSYAWLGVCAGSGTPPQVVTKLNGVLREILATPEYKELTSKTGAIPESSTPQEFEALMQKTVDDVAPILKELDIHVD
jgi:tripartite-type tricarboxylate transporter receptor subunit TctC